MADSFLQAPTDGGGKKLDTRTEATNSEHRQVVVLGDPAANAGVAPVDATKGLAVDLTATGANATPVKVNVASGGIASGAIASGAIAAGAIADGADVTIGSKADAKSTATDTTSISGMSVWKQISASIQAAAASLAGTLTVASHAVTNAGTFAVQAAVTAASGAFASGSVASGAVVDGAMVTVGAKADAANTATDTTAVTAMSVWKQISKTLQAAVSTASARFIVTLVDGSNNPVTWNANGQATAANSASIVGASDRQNTVAFSVAMTTDTSAYASGDVIADTQQLASFFNKTDGCGVIDSITIIDQDNQGAALYVLFHKASTSLGTENSAASISDANALNILGFVQVNTGDYITLGASNQKVACLKNIGLPVKAVSGTSDLYVSILNATGTPTYTATGLNLVVGALLD